MAVVMAEQMTWNRLTELEPRLLALEAEIRKIKRPRRGAFCANAVWYGYAANSQRGGFKGKLARLIGWDASLLAVANARAWDTAYQHLYSLLPGCRDCRCIPSQWVEAERDRLAALREG